MTALFTPEEWRLIAREYQAGMTTTELAEKYYCHNATIRSGIRKHTGVEITQKNHHRGGRKKREEHEMQAKEKLLDIKAGPMTDAEAEYILIHGSVSAAEIEKALAIAVNALEERIKRREAEKV